jgi:sugar transferase (PEP-CTERM/EpsH1 system associated)
MALHHDVDLICFGNGDVDEWEARERLKNLCHRVQMTPIETPPQHPSRMRNLFARRPLALRRYYRRDLFRRLQGIGETRRYDLVFVHSAAMAPYLDAFPKTPKVLDLVDVGSLRWLEYSHLSRFPQKTVYKAEAARLRQVELRGAATAQRTIFASEAEAEAFRELWPQPDRIGVVKTPVSPRAPLLGPWAPDPTILLAGHLDHFPNADAALWFTVEVFPKILDRIPRAKLVIAGKNPSAELRFLADRPEITLVERRHDFRQLYRDAWVAVAPHRVHHGVRNEVLEALAVGVPVVASEAAANGLDLLRGGDVEVATGPIDFSDRVVKLLTDPARLDRLGEAGRKAVHNNYSHWSVGIRLEEIVGRAAGDPVPQP